MATTAVLSLGPILAAALFVACAPAPPAAAPTSPPGAPKPAEGSAVTAPAERASAPAATSPSPAPRESIKLAYSAVSTSNSIPYVIQKAGIFDKYGLDAEIILLAGVASVQALVAGEVDFALAPTSGIISADLSGSDLVMLLSPISTLPFEIWSIAELTRPEDLRGRRLGISTKGSTTDFVARYVLPRFGLQPDVDVTIVAIGGVPQQVPAMEAGAIDAGVLSDPTTFAAEDRGYRRLIDVGGMGIEYIFGPIAVKRSTLSSRGAVVARFVRAYVEGIHYWKTQKDEAVRYLGEYTKVDDRARLERTYDLFATKYIQEVPIPSEKGAQTALDELAASVPAAANARPGDFLEPRFVRELEQSGFIRQLYTR